MLSLTQVNTKLSLVQVLLTRFTTKSLLEGLPTASKDEQKQKLLNKELGSKRAIRSFGDVFVPLLPAIVATGLFMGIRGAINNDTVLCLVFGTTSKAFAATDFYTYTVVLTDTAFAFFPSFDLLVSL